MKILFATDGSDNARGALDFMLAFPFPEDKHVTLISVVDQDLLTSAGAAGLSPEQQSSLREAQQAVIRSCSEMLAKEAERARKSGWAGKTLVRSGHPAEEIVRAASELGSDLVVMGSHGHTGIKRYLLGSVSSAVLEHAHCSVMIVKHAREPGAEAARLRILLAYDDSTPARQAVDFCAALPLGDHVEITALSVLPLVTLYRQDIKQRLSWFWQQKKRVAQTALERVVKELKWATSNVESRLRESGDVTNEILQTATALNSDLIIVGHKGKGAIERFLIGSTAARVARHAPCSVLAVRAG